MTLEYLGIGSTTNISESYNATTEVPFPSHIHTAKNDDVRYNWDRSVDRTRKLALAIAIPVVLLLFVILIAIAWVTVFEVRWNQRRVDVEASGNTNQTGGRTSASSEYSSPEVIHVPKRNGHNTPEAWANGIHQERVVS
uniref:Uncharacterized protein n=1 Tax=Ciona intestinalis TaxID=7719 RepID=H2XUW2_CIOIN